MRFFVLLLFSSLSATCGFADTQIQWAETAEQKLRAGDSAGAISALEKASAETSTAAGEDKIGFLYAVAGHQDDATAHFQKAIQTDVKFPAAHFHLGALRWIAKDHERGLNELQSAARLGPGIFDYRFRLGSAYVETGENDKAVDELKAAVALVPTSADAWQQLGLAEQHKNDLGSAVEAYARAVKLNAQDDVVRNTYSALLIETRQPERGIQEAEKVLAHNEKDTSAQMNIGYAHLKMGEFAKAENAYRRVVELEPGSAAAHYDLAIALKMQDQIEAAQKEFSKSIEFDPTLAEAHYTLGITNWQLGDFPGTIEQMKAAIAIRPEYAEAHYMLGIALKQSGDSDQALAELRESIRLDPSTPGPYNTMGQILRIKGDKQGSEEAFATGAKLKRDKEAQLAHTLKDGMHEVAMPKPITTK